MSQELIWYQNDACPTDGTTAAAPETHQKRSVEILDLLFDECERRGLYIMLDLHRLNQYAIAEVWYDLPRYTEETFVGTWSILFDRYGNRSTLMAVDLLNEVHNKATWGSDDPSTDWRLFVEKIITGLGSKYPEWQGLWVVEGISWGKWFGGLREYPLRLPPGLLERTLYFPLIVTV